MWIRSRLDIGWRELIFALAFCFRPDSRAAAGRSIADAFGADRNLLVTLSVRSSFDLLLRSLNLPAGSEVLFTAVTVPGMVEIARHHGLTPVPVDIDRNGNVCPESLEAAISDRSRIFVVAHLFGGRTPLDEVEGILRDRNILLVEDCAQSFSEVGVQPHPRTDVAMYSFGPIKTATALGGGIIEVRSQSLLSEMRCRLNRDPPQTRLHFAARIIRFSAIKLLTLRVIASGVFLCLNKCGIQPDRVLGKIAQGFSSDQLIRQIRCQPSSPLMRLLSHRLRHYDFARIAARTAGGRRMDAALQIDRDRSNTYWAYPIWVKNRRQVRDELRTRGFDATWATRLIVVPSQPGNTTPHANEMWSRVLFLPCYCELSKQAIDQMAEIVARVGVIDEESGITETKTSMRCCAESAVAALADE